MKAQICRGGKSVKVEIRMSSGLAWKTGKTFYLIIGREIYHRNGQNNDSIISDGWHDYILGRYDNMREAVKQFRRWKRNYYRRF